MSELKEEHFEVISKNKAKVYEEQKGMREELLSFVAECSAFNMQELYIEMQRMKRIRKDVK